MAVRKLKPTTPGQRHKIIGAFDTITASAPEKSLVVGVRKSGGRNIDNALYRRRSQEKIQTYRLQEK